MERGVEGMPKAHSTSLDRRIFIDNCYFWLGRWLICWDSLFPRCLNPTGCIRKPLEPRLKTPGQWFQPAEFGSSQKVETLLGLITTLSLVKARLDHS
ncbi:uncharacterized protein BJX67DRAFT_368262 [Aspergillus lucknowensis]|uniref:Uncharacterized protein n=1 Tax=Aspergillus lucknowensis TaxID=176173 RepID=A0ABR4L827_9EURO